MRAIVLFIGAPLLAIAQTAPQYRLVDLGTGINATAISSRGTVAGTRIVNGIERPFLYDGSFHDLNFAGIPAAVNARGEIAGKYCVDPSCSGTHAFLFDGGFTDLTDVPGVVSSAVGINNRGQVIGTEQVSGGAPQGFVWTAGSLQSLGGLIPLAINSAGHILAAGVLVVDGATQTLPGNPRVLSDTDAVAGFFDPTEPAVGGRAYLWRNGSYSLLPMAGAGPVNVPGGITNSGMVVGGVHTCSNCVWYAHWTDVLWLTGAAYTLNELLLPPARGDWWIGEYGDSPLINARGTIVTRAYYRPSPTAPAAPVHTVMLVPVYDQP